MTTTPPPLHSRPPSISTRGLAPYVVLALALAATIALAALHVLTEENASRIVCGCIGASLYLARPPGDGGHRGGGAMTAAAVSFFAGEVGAQLLHVGGMHR